MKTDFGKHVGELLWRLSEVKPCRPHRLRSALSKGTAGLPSEVRIVCAAAESTHRVHRLQSGTNGCLHPFRKSGASIPGCFRGTGPCSDRPGTKNRFWTAPPKWRPPSRKKGFGTSATPRPATRASGPEPPSATTTRTESASPRHPAHQVNRHPAGLRIRVDPPLGQRPHPGDRARCAGPQAVPLPREMARAARPEQVRAYHPVRGRAARAARPCRRRHEAGRTTSREGAGHDRQSSTSRCRSTRASKCTGSGSRR